MEHLLPKQTKSTIDTTSINYPTMKVTKVAAAAEAPKESPAANIEQQEEDTALIDASESWLDEDDESVDGMFFSDDGDDSSMVPSSLDELMEEFKARDALLDRLTNGVHPTHARLMRENEEAVRKQKLQRLSHENDKKQITNSTGILGRSYRSVAFDVGNMLQGVFVLALNCVAYSGFSQLVGSLVVLLPHGVEFEDSITLPVLMMLMCVFTLRLTGGVYDWVDSESYARIKFDMTNRLRLGRYDAIIMKWFLEHESLSTFLNVMSFFTFSNAIYAYQEQALGWAFDNRKEVFQSMPSVQQGLLTSASKKLSSRLGDEFVQRVLASATCSGEAGTCTSHMEVSDELTLRDEAFLASNTCTDCYTDLMGNDAALLCSESVLFWFYTLSAIVALVVLKIMGHKFWLD